MSDNSILQLFSSRFVRIGQSCNEIVLKEIFAITIVGTPHKHVTLCLISTSMARLCSRQFALYVYT